MVVSPSFVSAGHKGATLELETHLPSMPEKPPVRISPGLEGHWQFTPPVPGGLSQISVHPLKKGDPLARVHPPLADVTAVAAGTTIREPPLNVNIPGETAAFLLGQVLGLRGFFSASTMRRSNGN